MVSNRQWIIVFVTATLFDSGIIVYATYAQNSLLLYFMIVGALLGAYLLFNNWNKDERTEVALNDASRDVIKIFFFLLVSVGVVFIILSSYTNSILWEIGATLVVAAILLIYLQAIVAVYYESQLR